MTHPTKHPMIPEHFLRPEQRTPFLLWVASYNLPPPDAYRLYKDWCDIVKLPLSRDDLDTLCGADFNVN
jgi:hypothetical protein